MMIMLFVTLCFLLESKSGVLLLMSWWHRLPLVDDLRFLEDNFKIQRHVKCIPARNALRTSLVGAVSFEVEVTHSSD